MSLLLFWLGAASEVFFARLTGAWQVVAQALGLQSALQRLQQGTSHQVTTRNLPAMLSYGVLYVATSLLLLRVVLGSARRWATAALLYVAGCLLCGLLLLLGKLGGNVPLLYRAGRQLIEFIVSPLPVILALVLLLPGLRRVVASPAPHQKKTF